MPRLTEPDSVSTCTIVLAIRQLTLNDDVSSLIQLRRKRCVAAVNHAIVPVCLLLPFEILLIALRGR
jgi:hypothetical protein